MTDNNAGNADNAVVEKESKYNLFVYTFLDSLEQNFNSHCLSDLLTYVYNRNKFYNPRTYFYDNLRTYFYAKR